jgi:hypothetical protein
MSNKICACRPCFVEPRGRRTPWRPVQMIDTHADSAGHLKNVMAPPLKISDGGNGLYIWKSATNILNKQS